MKYPYILLGNEIKHKPIFKGLRGIPHVADMSYKNPVFSEMDVRDQKAFQALLEKEMAPDHTWGVSGYLERRDTLLADCPQMVEEQRFFHLGLDIIVPKGEPLHAPVAGTVHATGYEEGEGNYGGFLLIKHEIESCEPFYSFYGHLSRPSLAPTGTPLEAGDEFARLGDFHENGNWFFHTHLQIITQEGLARGYLSKGYCAAGDLAEINDLCPSPVPLFRI